ncbi:MAG: protein-arginine deiminase [Actinomycetota bacterium]|nr:protein-arginine deiminase [Actinomycetota bacterium]
MAELSFVQTRGTGARFEFNKRDGHIVLVEGSEGLQVRYVKADSWVTLSPGESVPAPLPYEGLMSVVAEGAGAYTALIHHVDGSGRVLDELSVQLYVLHVRVDVDADRDGVIGDNEEGKRNWVWGEGQRGAITLVNNDRDTAALTLRQAEDSELTHVMIRPTVAPLPLGCELVLVVTPDEAARISIYRSAEGGLELLLGVDPTDASTQARSVSPPLGSEGVQCFLEAHEYPGPFFEGLLSLELQLRQRGRTVGNDRALVRVAPWIMTPNTLPVEEVYTCDTRATDVSNETFLRELEEVCATLDVPLRIVSVDEHQGDRWIQDEVEFGFSESSTHLLPVVCDSPRDRELDHWSRLQVGPDLGHFQLGGSSPNSLDSFGNLEVSPPVTVRGRHYPFGRIVFGGREYGDYGEATRQMMPELRRFLHAQKVQAPIEIYTDWLIVGHVDEIVNFVPARNEKGFQVLLASPRKAQGVLDKLIAEGHGDALMFEGLRRGDPAAGTPAEVGVQELRSDLLFWEANDTFQTIMDLNREMLLMELDIGEADVIELPVLFWPSAPADPRTAAFFPDLINHLVIGDVSVVPRPYGPHVNGEDAFERAFRDALPDRDARFIDDWYAYHEQLGEVHCGTNTRRRPPTDVHWWEHRPEGGFDI